MKNIKYYSFIKKYFRKKLNEVNSEIENIYFKLNEVNADIKRLTNIDADADIDVSIIKSVVERENMFDDTDIDSISLQENLSIKKTISITIKTNELDIDLKKIIPKLNEIYSNLTILSDFNVNFATEIVVTLNTLLEVDLKHLHTIVTKIDAKLTKILLTKISKKNER